MNGMSLSKLGKIATLLFLLSSKSCRAASFVSLCPAIVLVIVAIGTLTSLTHAQGEPPASDENATELVGWDLFDPVNQVQRRQFFAGIWFAEEAGLPRPEFEFTNTPPGLMLAMLLPELEVFTEVYHHRLQLEFGNSNRYLVTDLIADDAAVRAEFRAFVLTGKLAPRSEHDSDAYLAHLDLVIDAITLQERASVVSVESLGMLIESKGLSLTTTAAVEDEPTLTPPTSQDDIRTKCALRWLLRASQMACVYAKLRTPASTEIDFDCDDGADALLRRLLVMKGPDGLRLLPPGWEAAGIGIVACGSPYAKGHAVPVLIDPQGRFWYL